MLDDALKLGKSSGGSGFLYSEKDEKKVFATNLIIHSGFKMQFFTLNIKTMSSCLMASRTHV